MCLGARGIRIAAIALSNDDLEVVVLEFADLKGMVINSILIVDDRYHAEHKDDSMEDMIYFNVGSKWYRLYHIQDCCENVYLYDVNGDIYDIIGEEVLLAEEVVNSQASSRDAESETWTFYKLATIKGAMTIRWVGSSNGYYSESVDFDECTQPI